MIDRKNFYINGQWVNPKSKEEIPGVDVQNRRFQRSIRRHQNMPWMKIWHQNMPFSYKDRH